MKKIKSLFLKYKEPILYVFFGGLTTLVNYIIYFSCTEGFRLGWSAATVLAWIGAVLFAYVTNRKWVFESSAVGAQAVVLEFAKFIAARLLSLGMEWVTLKLLLDILHMNNYMYASLPVGEFAAKTIAQVIVIIANYIFGKWVVFRKKNIKDE